MDDKETEQLLRQFMNEGMSSIRALKEQNDAIHKDMTDLKVAISTIREQIGGLTEAQTKGQERLEKETEELRKKVEESQKTLNEMEREHNRAMNEMGKEIVALKNKSDTLKIERLEEEVTELEKRVGMTETQQNKWLGALTVVGIIIGFLLAIAKGWVEGVVGGV